MAQAWSELLQSELRIDLEETRAEMIRVSVIAYLGCVATGLLSLSVARWQTISPLGSTSVIVIASLTALAIWWYRWRLAVWVLIAQAPYAAVLLALGLWAAGPDLASMFSLFYVLVILYGTFFLRLRFALALIVLCSATFAAAVLARGEPDWVPQVVRVFGTSLTIGLFVGLMVKRFHERAVRDPLTGLLNRRMWESLVAREISKAERSGQSFSILLLDLDGFKTINDRHGHLRGDEILKEVADVLRSFLRDEDSPCRWGGDEFAVLLTDCDAARLRGVVKRLHDELAGTLEVSIGGATWSPGATRAELFQRADESLYAAKGGGTEAGEPQAPRV